MDKCEFEVIQRQSKQKKNLISMVLFITESNKYKTPQIYYLGLQRFMRTQSPIFKDCNVLLFLDENVLQIKEVNKVIEKLKANYEQLSVVKFNCPQFKYKIQDINHADFIATTLRFYPLFEGKQFKEYKQVLIFDTELSQDILNSLAIVHKSKVKYDICFHDFQNHSQHAIEKYYISAGAIISNMKFPPILFETFIDNYNRDNNHYVNVFKSHGSKYIEGQRYPYGIDEMFLNSEFKSYLNDRKVFVVHLYTLSNFIFDNYQYLMNSEERSLKYLEEITLEKGLNVKQQFNLIQRNIWAVKKLEPQSVEVAQRIYEIFHRLQQQKSSDFIPLSYINWMLKEYDQMACQITGFLFKGTKLSKKIIILQTSSKLPKISKKSQRVIAQNKHRVI